MAQIRTTTYVCDRCGGNVPAQKDLRKFGLHLRRGAWAEILFDLCHVCEMEFLNSVSKFTNVDSKDVAELRRDEP